MDGNKVWETIVSKVSERIPEQSFNTWIRPLRLKAFENGELVVATPNNFYIDWIEEHYMSIFKQVLKELALNGVKIRFVSERRRKKLKAVDVQVPANTSMFQPHYSLAVAQNPGKVYNPLFIYGKVGLGKTHLLHSIGNYVFKHRQGLKVCYVSCEVILNEMIESIKDGTMSQFKQKYRSFDVFLLDDVQFLSQKERLQEEIFHIFNYLYNANKQIVLTSDSLPQEIPYLEERLASRFAWGLIADLKPPDFETRVAILKKKAELYNVVIPEDALLYIAEHIRGNIRNLESAIVRVMAVASLTGTRIDLELVKECLSEILKVSKKITLPDIQERVAKAFDIPLSVLRSKKRSAHIVLARQVAMYLAREILQMPLKEIGKAFGGKDHTTVMYACQKVEQLMEKDVELREKVFHIKKLIQSFTQGNWT
ncbi:chromosomal replication initiation protein DnaA [candidate division bacterium WOR-3 4484_18]|uniref:Chromosomal replication initiator protein DnaA n=1 Tax=candidate division WOR-3 bacterium 4484_18 TaxID=2020626 RepID=A0A257LVZ1_UNCW3|nr:MAG: chromosomal replication initiation protein DnaA [candidate division bacterium WOR-3 4484_18]